MRGSELYKETPLLMVSTENEVGIILDAIGRAKILLHTLFKYHLMSYPADLTTFRRGVGSGFILY